MRGAEVVHRRIPVSHAEITHAEAVGADG